VKKAERSQGERRYEGVPGEARMAGQAERKTLGIDA
jgi:hypothetical protein